MKIIKHGSSKGFIGARGTCARCGAELEVDDKDVVIDRPVCATLVMADPWVAGSLPWDHLPVPTVLCPCCNQIVRVFPVPSSENEILGLEEDHYGKIKE